jgi:hypothetical protein
VRVVDRKRRDLPTFRQAERARIKAGFRVILPSILQLTNSHTAPERGGNASPLRL